MATYNTGLLINKLTAVDQAMLDVLHNKLTVYPADARGRERVIPARMSGLDEEFQDVEYPLWVIVPLDFQLDLRRITEQPKITTESQASRIVRKAPPTQPYLVPYVIYGYCQDNRILREMQIWLALTFPRNAFITENGHNHYVELVGQSTSTDKDVREFAIQSTYQVWVELDAVTGVDYKKVFGQIKIGYSVGVGRQDLTENSVQTGVSGVFGIVGELQIIESSGISGILGYPAP